MATRKLIDEAYQGIATELDMLRVLILKGEPHFGHCLGDFLACRPAKFGKQGLAAGEGRAVWQ